MRPNGRNSVSENASTLSHNLGKSSMCFSLNLELGQRHINSNKMKSHLQTMSHRRMHNSHIQTLLNRFRWH